MSTEAFFIIGLLMISMIAFLLLYGTFLSRPKGDDDDDT
jgi:hypothetical protein